MLYAEQDYLKTLRDLTDGYVTTAWQKGRTAEQWRALRGPVTLRHFDADAGSIPLLQSKRLPPKVIIAELVGFIRGETNVAWYQQRGCNIWNEWAGEGGRLGPIYGAQWRRWGGWDDEDQLRDLVDRLRRMPNDRRGVVSAWNVQAIPRMALPPCHFAFQCIVLDGRLDMAVTMRSGDWFLGIPFNLASYGIFQALIARELGVPAGMLSLTINVPHIYENHIDAARQQLAVPAGPEDCAVLEVDDGVSIFDDDFDVDKLRIKGYRPCGPRIPAPVAV